jgi:virulence factor Mce-like protein
MTRRGTAALVASPVLVGAVTVLVAVLAVFLAYNANQGLPFVPTYDVRAEIPGGSNLVQSNEVKVGGFRVGSVEEIRPAVAEAGEGRAEGESGAPRAIAVIEMKLDKSVEPLPADTRIAIRPRSALGLKYVELRPGRSKRMLAAGDTIPLRQSVKPIELDEFFSTFDDEMRKNQRTAIEGYGTALAGRGESINRAIEEFVPFVTELRPVMRALSDPDTELSNFFRQARRTSGQLAPVAPTYAQLFQNMAVTFEALSRHPDRLQAAVERAPDTLEAGIDSFPVQRPFLRDSRRLAARLEPVAEEIERSLPPTTAAFRTGAPVLAKAPPFYRRTRDVFDSLHDLAENPNTLLALRDLRRTLTVATPLVEYVAPYQTVCNFWTYYWTAISEHVSETVRGGTGQRSASKSDNRIQDNRVSSSDADRPVDVAANEDPQKLEYPNGEPAQALHGGGYSPAITSDGFADCRVGQRGYLDGPSVNTGRYSPSNDVPLTGTDNAGGGSHVVLDTERAGLPRAGGTYKSRELGIDHVEDVP